MSDVVERCAVCQALLDEEDLFCPNCGTETPVPAEVLGEAPRVAGAPFVATHNFNCQGCGASMSYDASAQTLRCPFCGSERLDQAQDARVVAPQSVVPFVIERSQATDVLRGWLRGGFWRPGDLSDAAIVTKMTPVFVPYSVFAARILANWTADSSQTPPGARGDWFPLSGEHSGDYQGLLVGASGALTPAETTAICPFDLSQGLPPDQVDLENVVYEQFRVQKKYARPVARQGFENRLRQECMQYVPGRCRNMKVNLQIHGLRSEAVLLPVWIMAYRYRDQAYRFLLNGQTGKATGQAPFSWYKLVVVAGLIIAGLVLAGLAIAIASSR